MKLRIPIGNMANWEIRTRVFFCGVEMTNWTTRIFKSLKVKSLGSGLFLWIWLFGLSLRLWLGIQTPGLLVNNNILMIRRWLHKMYFIWRCPSKPIKVINSLMNVKVDRKFSSKNIFRTGKSFPSLCWRKSCQRFTEDYIQLAIVWRAWVSEVWAWLQIRW